MCTVPLVGAVVDAVVVIPAVVVECCCFAAAVMFPNVAVTNRIREEKYHLDRSINRGLLGICRYK